MQTQAQIRQRRAQEFAWLIKTGMWWVLIALMGAAAFIFLYLYDYWKKAPSVPARILSVEKRRGSHNTSNYRVLCEYTDPNGEKQIAAYSSGKAPAGNETNVYVNPKHPDRINGPDGPENFLMLFWIFLGICALGCIAGALY